MNLKYTYELREIAEVVDCEHKTAPTVDTSEYYSVRTSNISNGKINFESCNRVSKETYQKWTQRAVPQTGDIVLAREAPVGEVGLIKNGYNVCLGQRTVLISVKEPNVHNKFLLYYLTSPNIKYELTARSTGSVVHHLNMKDIRAFEVQLPPLPEQKAIASVLSSLDDKIDLLHRQNKTLEAMAETLFRQWFVEEGDSNTLIPLSYYADNIRENVKKDELSQYKHYVGLEHIPRKCLTLSTWGNTTELGSNKSKFGKNDILFGKLRSYFHKVVFASIEGVCSTDILVIRPKKEEFFSFCLFWFFNSDVVEYSDLGSEGTRMPRTNWKILSGYQVPKVNEDKIGQFDTMVRPLIAKMQGNVKQIHALEKLRDTLLPKLMSGEVRVKL